MFPTELGGLEKPKPTGNNHPISGISWASAPRSSPWTRRPDISAIYSSILPSTPLKVQNVIRMFAEKTEDLFSLCPPALLPRDVLSGVLCPLTRDYFILVLALFVNIKFKNIQDKKRAREAKQ